MGRKQGSVARGCTGYEPRNGRDCASLGKFDAAVEKVWASFRGVNVHTCGGHEEHEAVQRGVRDVRAQVLEEVARQVRWRLRRNLRSALVSLNLRVKKTRVAGRSAPSEGCAG